MMDPGKVIDSLLDELAATVKAMSKTKSVDEKVVYSQVVKNLSESLGVFINAANRMMADDYDFDFDDN